MSVFVYKMNRMGLRTEPCGTPKFSKLGYESFVVTRYSPSSIGNVGSELFESCTRNSVDVLKSLKDNAVINGVERS